MEHAKQAEMSVEDFRMACMSMVIRNEATPGQLVKQGLAQKLNVIFDIDHTLIHSVDERSIAKLPDLER